jgi:hypothetical protein
MKKVCFQFPSITMMNDFLQVIENINCEFNHQRLTLICELTERECQMAIEDFGARLFEEGSI